MRSLLIAFLIGCGSSPPPPAPVANTPPPPPPPDAAPSSPRGEAAVAKLNEFADTMCKCTTKACAQKVSDDMAKWGQELTQTTSPDEQMTDAQTQQATAIGQRLGECVQKAMTGP
ncbi:MAG: hypothetical protein ABI678_23775 [Kofleriaceae bacterium]